MNDIKLSKLKTGDAPAKAVQEVVAEVAPEMGEDVNAVTIFGESGANAALLAVVDETTPERKLPFPVIMVAGGVSASAGQYGPMPKTPDEIAAKLPAGRGPIGGVFMGYRTEVIAWPTGYNDRDTATEGADKPSWGGLLDPRNIEDAKLVTAASEAYQFTKAIERSKFDAVGHIKPSIQILLFLPSLGAPVVIQAPAHHNTWAMTSANLKRLIDPKTKNLGQFPCTVRPIVQERNGRKDTFLETAQLVTDQSKPWWDAYQAWRTAAMLDPEQVALIRGWLNGVDAPINDEIRAKLKACAALKTQR